MKQWNTPPSFHIVRVMVTYHDLNFSPRYEDQKKHPHTNNYTKGTQWILACLPITLISNSWYLYFLPSHYNNQCPSGQFWIWKQKKIASNIQICWKSEWTQNLLHFWENTIFFYKYENYRLKSFWTPYWKGTKVNCKNNDWKEYYICVTYLLKWIKSSWTNNQEYL